MTTDAALAIVHHLAAFALIAVLFAEWMVLRPGITPAQLKLIGKADMAYGALAAVVLAAGSARVLLGPKGAAFYTGNPLFWTKIAVFAAVGLLSVVPTTALIRWRRSGMPAEVELQRVRGWLNLQASLVLLLPVLAALMARGIGY